jgi:hypothetical protein
MWAENGKRYNVLVWADSFFRGHRKLHKHIALSSLRIGEHHFLCLGEGAAGPPPDAPDDDSASAEDKAAGKT